MNLPKQFHSWTQFYLYLEQNVPHLDRQQFINFDSWEYEQSIVSTFDENAECEGGGLEKSERMRFVLNDIRLKAFAEIIPFFPKTINDAQKKYYEYESALRFVQGMNGVGPYQNNDEPRPLHDVLILTMHQKY